MCTSRWPQRLKSFVGVVLTIPALVCVPALLCIPASQSFAKHSGMQLGTVELKSIGPMTFASEGVLLVGDPKTATVYAIDTEDGSNGGASTFAPIKDIAKAVAKTMQVDGRVDIGELAVNPVSGSVFLSVSHDQQVHLVKVDQNGAIEELNLDKVHHSMKTLPNAPEDKETVRRGRKRNPRMESITDLAYFDGKVMITGKSTDDSPSRVLEMPIPFADNSITTSVEIFHAAHGRVEDSTIRTFLPILIDGQPNLLAGFTCTPLVRFPVDQLKGSEKVRGATVAELGNRNQPLDMVVYEKAGTTSILMTNSTRGTMKITTDGIGERESLSEKVSGGGTAGQPFESVPALDNVTQMDKWSDSHAIALMKEGETLTLTAIELP